MKKGITFLLFFVIIFAVVGRGSTGTDDGVAHFEFTHIEVPVTPVATVRVSPTIEIIGIFQHNDVDPKYLSMTKSHDYIPDDVRADISKVIGENEDDILDKIKEELKSSLLLGQFDYAYMVIGSRMFTMRLYYR